MPSIFVNHLRIRTVQHQLDAAGLPYSKVEAYISSVPGYRSIAVHIERDADRDSYIDALIRLPWPNKRVKADLNPYIVVDVPEDEPAFLPAGRDLGDRIAYEDIQPGDVICIPDEVAPGAKLFDAVLKSWMPAHQVRAVERESTGQGRWVIHWAHTPAFDGDTKLASRIERHEQYFGVRLIARLGLDFGAELADEFTRLDARA